MARLIVEINIPHTTKDSFLAAIENNRLHLRIGDYDPDNGNDGFIGWMEDADHIGIDEMYLRRATDDDSFFAFKLRAVED